MSVPPARFRSGLIAALPIVLGYLPIAFSFGIAATKTGLTALEATFLSLVIYAGASQFLALALVASGAPVLVSAATLIAMNLRHVVYGPALMRAGGGRVSRRGAGIWGWGLTDEVFGQALGHLARGGEAGPRFMTGLGLAAYAAWVGGTVAGALAQGSVLAGYPAVEAGLSFMLVALFLALLLSILTRAALPAVGAAIVVTVAGTVLFGGTTGILAGIMGGAVAGTLVRGAR